MKNVCITWRFVFVKSDAAIVSWDVSVRRFVEFQATRDCSSSFSLSFSLIVSNR